MIVFIKLVLAHLVGDFILQFTSWVKAKEKKKWKAYQLYLHALLHGVLMLLLIWEVTFIPWAILLAIIHLVIDGVKLVLQSNKTKRGYFFADQIAHLISIYVIYRLYSGTSIVDSSYFSEANFLLITMLVFLTTPASYITSTFITRWAPHTEDDSDDSLRDAGKYIGMLERLLAFVFVITGNWGAVGFLLAAKSIFRFGDLKEPRDRKLTEYILIGTLLSFGLAVMAALAYITWLPQMVG